jgi:hypothetical protein
LAGIVTLPMAQAFAMHVWNRRRLQALFVDVKTVCMHVCGLPVGASKHARSTLLGIVTLPPA